jgi:hypothetical protein
MGVENARAAIGCARCGVTVLCLSLVDESNHHYDDEYHNHHDLPPWRHGIVDPHRAQGTKSDDGDDRERRRHDAGRHNILDLAFVGSGSGDRHF